MLARSYIAVLALLAVVGGVALSAGQALAETVPAMTLGRETPPPRGFLDLCRRDPSSCANADDPASIVAARDATEIAVRDYWLLRVRTVQTPSVAPAAVAVDQTERGKAHAPALVALPEGLTTVSNVTIKPDFDCGSVGIDVAGAMPVSAMDPAALHWPSRSKAFTDARPFAAWLKLEQARGGGSPLADQPQTPARPSKAVPTSVPIGRHSGVWRSIQSVNQAVNRSIRSRSDQELFGRADVWQTSAEGPVTTGDCEDFVIEKRHRLMAAGVRGDQMSIALVQTPWGQSHAVLVVATTDGDYVLDSLTPWIVAWQKTGYLWTSRQIAGDPLRWVEIVR